MAEIKSFLIYYDTKNLIGSLSDSQAGRLLKSLFRFAVTGETEDFSDDGMVKMAFSFMSEQIERDALKYKAKCEKNKQIAIERERKRRERRNLIADNSESTPTESHEILISDTKKPVNVSVKEEQPESVFPETKPTESVYHENKHTISVSSDNKHTISIYPDITPTEDIYSDEILPENTSSGLKSLADILSGIKPISDILSNPPRPENVPDETTQPESVSSYADESSEETSYDPYYNVPFEPKDEDAPPFDPSEYVPLEEDDNTPPPFDPSEYMPLGEDDNTPPFDPSEYVSLEEDDNALPFEPANIEKTYYSPSDNAEDMPTPEEIEELLKVEQSLSADLPSETEDTENLSSDTNNDNFMPSHTNVNERVLSNTAVDESIPLNTNVDANTLSYINGNRCFMTDEDFKEIDQSKLSYIDRAIIKNIRENNLPITPERLNDFKNPTDMYGSVNCEQAFHHLLDINHSNRSKDPLKNINPILTFDYDREEDVNYLIDLAYQDKYIYDTPSDEEIYDEYFHNPDKIAFDRYLEERRLEDEKKEKRMAEARAMLTEEDYRIIAEIAERQDKEALQRFIEQKEKEISEKEDEEMRLAYESLKNMPKPSVDIDELARIQQEKEKQENVKEFEETMRKIEETNKKKEEEWKKKIEESTLNEEEIKMMEERKRKMIELLNTTATPYEIEWFVNTFNNICVSYDKVEYEKLSEADTAKVTKLILGFSDKEIIDAMCTMEESCFLLGKKNNGSTKYKKWKADFSWFITYNHFMNILSGTYNSTEEGFDLDMYRAFLKDMEYVEMNPDA